MTFFTDIRNKFKEEYSGRYLAHIVQAISIKHPEILRPFFPRGGKVLRCETEFLHSKKMNGSSQKDRFADLAIFEGDEPEPSVLVEIKAKDHRNLKHNNPQLEAYIRWAKEGKGRQIVVLTQYSLPEETRKIVNISGGAAREMSFLEFVNDKKFNQLRSSSDFVDHFYLYLQEQGLVMHKFSDSDIEALLSFLYGMFLPHAGGHGKVNAEMNSLNGPHVFANLLQNFKLVADGLYANRYGPAIDTARRPVMFVFSQQEYKGGSKLKDDDWSRHKIIDRNFKCGGSMFVYASSVVSSVGSRAYLVYGLQLRILDGKEQKGFSVWPFAEIKTPGIKGWQCVYSKEILSATKKGKLSRLCGLLSDPIKLEQLLFVPMRDVVKEVLALDGPKKTTSGKEFRAKVSALQKSLK